MNARASVSLTGEQRVRIERLVENLIRLLDRQDGDADFEDDGTAESSLGWTATMATSGSRDLEEDETCAF